MTKARALVVAVCAMLAGPVAAVVGQPVPRGDAHVRLLVEDRSGMFDDVPLGTLFIGSSANGWDPRGTWSMGHYGPVGETPGGWMFEIPREVASDSAFEFKFTRGGWDTVEVDAHGGDVANRRLGGLDWADRPADDPPEVTVVLAGFADQHGAVERQSTVTGELEIFAFRSELLDNERSVRVWLPPGYGDAANAGERYPVLYMHDGQNLFDAATSFIGVEWGVDEAVTGLIAAGEMPATIVVGIDNAGPDRAAEYNASYVEWEDQRLRGETYLAFLETELMPAINERYRTRVGREHTAIGGSSFGGNITLLAAMETPELYSRYLVESPASWIGGGVFLERIESHRGWDGRFFVGMGTREYGEGERDAQLVGIAERIAAALRSAGAGARVALEVDEGAAHNEAAWARRLPGALGFLWADVGR